MLLSSTAPSSKYNEDNITQTWSNRILEFDLVYLILLQETITESKYRMQFGDQHKIFLPRIKHLLNIKKNANLPPLNIPKLSAPSGVYYPSQDPARMGALSFKQHKKDWKKESGTALVENVVVVI